VPSIPAQIISADVVCYDMVYGRELTPFLMWAKEQGSDHLIDGLGMLVGQAAESFAIWREVKPEVESVIASLRKSLAGE
jgi:shikimate dehydrogenase